MLTLLRGKYNTGILVPILAGVVALLGLISRIPGSPTRFLTTERAPAMALDTAIGFLVSTVAGILLSIDRASQLRRVLNALLLLGGLAYPFAAASNLPTLVEHAALATLGLLDNKVGTPMPTDSALAFALLGAIGLGWELDSDRRKWMPFAIAACGTALVTFGSLSLLHTLVQLPFNSFWGWARSLSRMATETAILFFFLGLYSSVKAMRGIPASAAQRTFVGGLFAAASMVLLFLSINVTLKVALDSNYSARAAIRDAHQSQTAIEQTAAFVREAESGQRGYLLTLDEQYAGAYTRGEREAQALTAKPLAVGNSWPETQAFRKVVSRKLDELRETVALQRAGRGPEAREVLRSGTGRQLMERMTVLRSAINKRMSEEIEARNAAYWRSAEVVSRTVFVSYGLASALLLCAAVMFRGEIERRAAVESRLRTNEAQLEERIRQRTGELEASENRFRALLEQSPIAAHIFNPAGETLLVNAAFQRLFSVTPERMKGYNVLQDPMPDRDGRRGMVKRAFDGEVVYIGAFRLDPSVKPVSGANPCLEVTAYPVKDSAGSVVEVVLLFSDVTARENALQSLRESEAHFRQLADSLPQMIWTADAQLKPLYLNSRWYEVTGWTPGNLDGDFFRIVHEEDRQSCREAWIRAVETAEPFEQDYRLFDASREEYRWYLARAIPLQDDGGNVRQWFGSLTEIHEQKEAEAILESRVGVRTAELQRSNQLLRASEEALREALQERETLFKEVHHRVKNNLQVISSLLRMKGQSLHDQPAAAMALEESRRRVQSMAFIHESLYSHGSMDRLDFASYTRTLARELIFAYTTPDCSIDHWVEADRVDLNVEQAIPCGLILNELLTNALKYAFRGRNEGTVWVILRNAASEELMLEVRDNGVGLPEGLEPANLDSLGLPIVEILTRQIGGRLEIEHGGGSETGAGACFTIYFPKQASAHRAA